jgi:hypothetical protein
MRTLKLKRDVNLQRGIKANMRTAMNVKQVPDVPALF